jgi:hypothetical protein
MGRVAEFGPTRETESGEETLRVVAVETAWRLIRRHPNWFRHYGFSVPDAESRGFLDSLEKIKTSVRLQVERTFGRDFSSGRRPALPDTLDAILTAAYLLRMGRRPVRPIPSGIGATWRALLPFCAQETTAERPAVVRPVSRLLEGEGWRVDPGLLAPRRVVH